MIKALLYKYGHIIALALFLVGAGCLCYVTYSITHKTVSAHYQKLMAEADKAHLAVYAKLEAEARQKEQKHAATLAAIDQKHTRRLKDVQTKNKADLAALRNGALQLRNRFLCPDAGSATGATLTSSGLGDGTGQGGLRIEDAEFLVSEADRADGIVIQLQACQEIIRADRAMGAK